MSRPAAELPPLVSREHLLAMLSEAAEIEHNLMCCYLYAMFSLKRHREDGLDDEELAAVGRWRQSLRLIAMEEMTHFTLVANLMSAVGGTPRFMRPNLPVPAGMYPADMVIELAPFDLRTLRHFVYLERPDSRTLADGEGFVPGRYQRHAPTDRRVMPYASDYATVGLLYRDIDIALVTLADRLGETVLFCGDASTQVGPADSPLPGLGTVHDLASARQAIETIVVQGEGSSGHPDSHFERYCAIQREYEALLARNADFAPAHPAARNPVMREPPTPQGRVWITEPLAGRYVDLANAVYALMLRILVQVYARAGRGAASRRALLQASFALMRAMVPLGERLAQLPANAAYPGTNAGMSFATLRSFAPLGTGVSERAVLLERIDELREALASIRDSDPACPAALDAFDAARVQLEKLEAIADSVPAAAPVPAVSAAAPRPVTAADGYEAIEGADITLLYHGKRCIHARHCVMELPGVFKANTPGDWIFPDAVPVEQLAAVLQKCPSGALAWTRKDDGLEEPAPAVNELRLRENGPLGFRADLHLEMPGGRLGTGFRATLCRCGASKNKPYCDGTHNDIAFKASGEPATGDTAALAARNGPLSVRPQRNGPLAVEGNLEVCAGTGRVVARTTGAYLCRCGQSGNKPFCDGSHARAGFEADGA